VNGPGKKAARGLGLLRGFRDFLRGIFKQGDWYEDLRSLQIAVSTAVAVVVMALVVWDWHRIERYRLAVGFAGLTVGFGIFRFISLHEVDARNVNAPWARTAIDLVAAAGVSAVAITRLCQLRIFPDSRRRTRPAGDDPHVSDSTKMTVSDTTTARLGLVIDETRLGWI
jgi:hypothetical protein